MDKFVIEGPTRLQGEVAIGGAKNAMLPIMAATLLARGKSVLRNVPRLRDTDTMISMLELLGATVTSTGNEVHVDTTNANNVEAPYDYVRKMRASIYVMGPLLAFHGRARVSMPGGCAWGPRPIDLHLMAMEQLGAEVELSHGYIEARCDRLQGGEVSFKTISVGATCQTMMAAALADGFTIINNAALEPEVTDLADALVAAGVPIEGRGTATLKIEGVQSVDPIDHDIIPDRIEAGTFAAAAVATRGDITMRGCNVPHLSAVLSTLQEVGATIETGDDWVRISHNGDINAVDVVTREYPGFPTDMQAQIMGVLCLANGVSTVKDTIYPDRFTHIPELRRFGADIRLDGNLAVIRGTDTLDGAPVMATDIRASSALILAAMAANGPTEMLRVYHIDRGYERIEEKLRALGARIQRVEQ